jgi:glycosyltransferase involved in cell wall biosynthesis
MFSIVMPVWNKRPYLAQTMAGALSQTMRDFELIAVDDGSTDGSLDLLRSFDDPRLHIRTQANAGPGPARNTGLEAARHDWIAFLDGDDLWLPDHLAELDRIRTAHPEAGLIGTNFIILGRDGLTRMPSPNQSRISEIDYFEARNPICTSSSAVARHVYRSLGGFSGAVPGQDSEYMARIALNHAVAVSSRATVAYRIGTGGISDAPTSPWQGKPIRSAADIEPSVALLVARLPEIECPRRRRAIPLYIDRKLIWCLRKAARTGDVATIRALPPLFSVPPPLQDRLILALARLPMPLVRSAYRIGRASKLVKRRLVRRNSF